MIVPFECGVLRLEKKKPSWGGYCEWVYSVLFCPDGKSVASGSGDRAVRVWDVSTGEEKAKLEGHRDRVHSVSFSPDGKTVAFGSRD